MNYAILRIAKRSLRQSSAMARHALRSMPTPNADPARLGNNTIVGPRDADQVVAQLRARTEPLVRRKDAVRVLELFVGASPEAMKGKSRKQQDAYFADALSWAATRFGGDRANIVFAAVHRDESTPHMQVLLTPIVGGKLAANQLIGGPAGLVKIQSEFATEVGAKHDLRRGERGSRAKHTTVRQFYAAIEAAGSLDALPPRKPVPPEPKEPGFISGDTERKKYAKAVVDRQAAIEANMRRQQRIEELAKIALAVHGRGRRRLPIRLDELEQREAKVEAREKGVARAAHIERAAREKLEQLNAKQREEVLANAKLEQAIENQKSPRAAASREARGSSSRPGPKPR